MKLNQNEIQTGESTYCPEDNKLRLYVGHVPREEFLALKSEGWKSTPKQDCDFVATWTPAREDTATAYGEGEILDEDQTPEDRAADRAERFGGYRDKRLDEAHGHADSYHSQPAAHGFQSQAKADRAARKHDRHAGRALSAWDRADYWQHRTAGVIRHALYVSTPGVRMGRIKKLESAQRKHVKTWTEHTAKEQNKFDHVQRVIEHAEGTAEKLPRLAYISFTLRDIKEATGTGDAEPTAEEIRLAVLASVLDAYTYADEAENALSKQARHAERPAVDIAREWIQDRTRPEDWNPASSRWHRHYELRLAYENQMLEGQGGRLEQKEIEIGGTIGGRLIVKLAKSPATKRVVSVKLLGPAVDSWSYNVDNIEGTDLALYHFKTERLEPDAYQAPTDESRAQLEDYKKALKATKAKKPAAPKLINPTDEDAERLQKLWNADPWHRNDEPAEVLRMTQNEYSRASKGSYARAEAVFIEEGGNKAGGGMAESSHRENVCKVRCNYRRVIILTDKPQKPLPAEVWQDVEGEARAWCADNLHLCLAAITAKRAGDLPEIHAEAWRQMRRARWVNGLCYRSASVADELEKLFQENGTYSAKSDGSKEPAAPEKAGQLVQGELLSA